jgi:hypothetical protein
VPEKTKPLTNKQVDHILRNWSTMQDTCLDTPTELSLLWPCEPYECKDVFDVSLVIAKKRDLPDHYRQRAQRYIEVLVARYPFQLRNEMARPMWHRFIDVWNDTGSFRRAMRVI